MQTYNEQTLDSILSYYNIPASSVKWVFLPLAEIGAAVHDKHVVAVLAVGLVLDEVVGLVDLADVVVVAADAAQQRVAADRLGRGLRDGGDLDAVVVGARRLDRESAQQRQAAVGELE